MNFNLSKLVFVSQISTPFLLIDYLPTATIMDKSSWERNEIFIFSVILVSLIKQCILLEIISQSSLPLPYTKLKVGKKFWIHVSNIVCGVRGGVGPGWIGKRPKMPKCPKTFVGWGEGLGLCELENAQKCQCPKTFVDDCSYLPSSPPW